MKERPIAFSTPMMRAYLAGLKTETRRIINPQPDWVIDGKPLVAKTVKVVRDRRTVELIEPEGKPGWRFYEEIPWPYQVGDHLRIKEDLRVNGTGTVAVYSADGLPVMVNGESLDWKWKRSRLPARFMPTVACRARPPVLEVSAERLQEIDEVGARAEGMEYHDGMGVGHNGWRPHRDHGFVYDTARAAFAALWDSINGKRATCKSNPWVFVIKFEQATDRKEVS